MSNLISIEELRENYLYDPKSGIVYSKKNNRGGDISPPKPAGTLWSHGYLVIRKSGKAYPAHRVAWALFHGKWPSQNIDHINGVRDDNRIENLRDVSFSDNSKNMRLLSRNKTGVPGVSWSASKQKWIAQITHRRKQIHLGTYSSFEEAVSARKTAEISWGFHENHGQRSRPTYHNYN